MTSSLGIAKEWRNDGQSRHGKCSLTSRVGARRNHEPSVVRSSQGPSSAVCMYVSSEDLNKVICLISIPLMMCERKSYKSAREIIIQEKRDVWDCIRLSFRKAPEVVGERFHWLFFLPPRGRWLLITCFVFHNVTASILRVFTYSPCCCLFLPRNTTRFIRQRHSFHTECKKYLTTNLWSLSYSYWIGAQCGLV